jgi:4-methyl-5(b-hydroxyethyl)-thiazole monophosphate biosynthesis
MAKLIVVCLAQGFEEIEAVTPVDVLRRAGQEVMIAGVEDELVEGSRGVPFGTDGLLEELSDTPDAVILPGGQPGADHLGASRAVRRLVEEVHDAGGIVGAICAAPARALAKWGLLDGRVATGYPASREEIEAVATWSDDPVVVDRNIVTSQGPGTALPFALELAEILAGEKAAAKVAAAMLAHR